LLGLRQTTASDKPSAIRRSTIAELISFSRKIEKRSAHNQKTTAQPKIGRAIFFGK